MVMSISSVAALYKQNAARVVQSAQRSQAEAVGGAGSVVTPPPGAVPPGSYPGVGSAQKPALDSFLQSVTSVAAQARNDSIRAENVSLDATIGQASVTELVTAISTAEASLQTIVSIRDRVLSAYQEIMRMPI